MLILDNGVENETWLIEEKRAIRRTNVEFCSDSGPCYKSNRKEKLFHETVLMRVLQDQQVHTLAVQSQTKDTETAGLAAEMRVL